MPKNFAWAEGRFKVLIFVSVLILVVLFSTVGAIKLTAGPGFCSQCHVMAPEFTTWHASSHVQIVCVDCHTKPGWGKLLPRKTSVMIYRYFSGTFQRPIKMSYKLEDEICSQCHSTNRDFTPSGDLIIPHQKHAAKKVQCVECHAGVAHGNIVERNLTIEDNYQIWTSAFGEKQMSRDFTEPKMNTCLKCHIERNITQECQACHTSISIPPDHKVKNWSSSHGLTARLDIDYCNKCHSYSVGTSSIMGQDKIASYARGNVFCYDCHQQRPSGHYDYWKMTHKNGIKNKDVSNCLVCHNVEKPKPADKAAPTYCSKCHGKASGAGNASQNGVIGKTKTPNSFSKLHPPNWRKLHPEIVKEKGIYNEGCWDCHDTIHCSKCHMNKL